MGVTINAKKGSITNKGTIDVAAGGRGVNLTAANDIALGRIDAGTGGITITASNGAISDNTAAEGAGNENLAGGNLSLTAATDIGGLGDAGDIDTKMTTL